MRAKTRRLGIAIASLILAGLAGVAWFSAARLSDSLHSGQNTGGEGSAAKINGPNPYFSRAAYYGPQAGQLVAPTTIGRIVVRRWTFEGGTTRGWRRVGNVFTGKAQHGVRVATTLGASAYQLISPDVRLQPGTYITLLNGRVLDGGLAFGALDVAADAWKSYGPGPLSSPAAPTLYWSQQPFDRLRMAARFELARRARIQLILSNWAPESYSSSWILRDVVIERLA
jgi:hypothetical protein